LSDRYICYNSFTFLNSIRSLINKVRRLVLLSLLHYNRIFLTNPSKAAGGAGGGGLPKERWTLALSRLKIEVARRRSNEVEEGGERLKDEDGAGRVLSH
jgi:hypothetical protein